MPDRRTGRWAILDAADVLPPGRPLCQEQEPIDGDPTGPMLSCALPAGHHSQEHYDRAFGLVWRRTSTQPAERPEPPVDPACTCGHPAGRHLWFSPHPCATGPDCSCPGYTQP